MNTTILAIDLDEFKSVACVYDKISNHAQFESFTIVRQTLVELIRRHQGVGGWQRSKPRMCGVHPGVDKAQPPRPSLS